MEIEKGKEEYVKIKKKYGEGDIMGGGMVEKKIKIDMEIEEMKRVIEED